MSTKPEFHASGRLKVLLAGVSPDGARTMRTLMPDPMKRRWGRSGIPRGSLGLAVACGMLVLLCGCAHRIEETGLSGFADATASVKQQTDDAFIRANGVSRTAAIDAFVLTASPGLTEAAFPAAVPPEVVASWDGALSGLQRYAALLSELVDPAKASATGDAFVSLGKEVQNGTLHVGINPSIATGFAALAETLVTIHAQSSARAILTSTDPSVHALLGAMADAIGATNDDGLRSTVWSNWTETLGPVRVAYAEASARHDAAAQRALAGTFLASVDQRTAEMQALANLRASLLALADAHHAAMLGASPSVKGLLQDVQLRAAETQRLFVATTGTAS